jgi:hypothetical protein
MLFHMGEYYILLYYLSCLANDTTTITRHEEKEVLD